MKRTQQRLLEFPSQRGRLCIGYYEPADSRCVSIHGDPEGLRSFGELLIAEAAVDQRKLPETSLSLGGRHHLHILAGVHIHPKSMDVVIGRLDAATSGEAPDWLRNTRKKQWNSIREGLDDGRVIVFPCPRGRILVFHCENLWYRAVGIFGDPIGLRSFGKLLIAEGDLDQTQFPKGNLPEGVGHHLHVDPGSCIHPQSIPVTICRLDGKVSGAMPQWLRVARSKKAGPSRLRKMRPVRQVLFKTERAKRRAGFTRMAPGGL